MKKFLRALTTKLYQKGEGPLRMYDEMRQHPGWQVHGLLLKEIRNGIMEDMLSERFTKLSQSEKDSQQKAYFVVNEIVEYLSNPLADMEKRNQFREGYTKATGIDPITGRDLVRGSDRRGATP